MTELGYFAPTSAGTQGEPTSPRRAAWRAAITVLATILGPPLALFAAFAASIVWSGCFMTCEGSDHLTGGLLWVLALGLLAAGPVLAATVMRSRTATMVTSAVGVGVVVLVVVPLLG